MTHKVLNYGDYYTKQYMMIILYRFYIYIYLDLDKINWTWIS